MEEKIVINFIGIGAQKSGTSWLFNNLKKLPDFSLLPIKELHYFDRHPKYPSSTILFEDSIFKRIKNPAWLFRFKIHFLRTLRLENIGDIKWKLKYFFSKVDNNWYLSLFENLEGLKGEVTPSYSILNQEDIQKMYRLAPNAKLILLLRNPIHRAWSQYRHEWRRLDDYSTREMDIETIIQFMNSDKQVLRSDYERMIKNYLSVYPRAQILIGFYDALSDNPLQLLEGVVDFIGGNTANIPEYVDLQQKFNVNPKIEMPKEVFEFLKSKYQKPMERLAEKYGNYFSVWLEEINGAKSISKGRAAATIKL